MKTFLLTVTIVLLCWTALAQDCSNDEFRAFCGIKAAVSRLLYYPAYTGWDEKTLNRAGDMAALAVIRSVPIEELNSPEKATQILLILESAFAAPQLIASNSDRRPTAAMLLLSYLSKTKYGQEHVNEIENTRYEIEHNASSGQPRESASLGGAFPYDEEHARWVDSVLRWTNDIKPGMTRKDLLQVYTVEGGLSTRTQRTYVLKGCGYVKIDVEFLPVGHEQDGATESPDDKILRISRPYLAYSHAD